jgi:hypothetical protein
MGMSTHAVGFKPPDAKWQQMKAIWDACEAADVELPDRVDDYFGGERPDPAGVEVSEDSLIAAGAVAKWKDEYSEGYEVHVDKLPQDVKIVRVYNSW